MEASNRLALQVKLQRAGVSALSADRLLADCATDTELVLVIVAMTSKPRVGDRLSTTITGSRKTLLVEDSAQGAGMIGSDEKRKWAVVGRPVVSSRRDDARISATVRRTA